MSRTGFDRQKVRSIVWELSKKGKIKRVSNLVVIVGTKRALAIAVKNSKTEKRYTYLRNRLAISGQ